MLKVLNLSHEMGVFTGRSHDLRSDILVWPLSLKWLSGTFCDLEKRFIKVQGRDTCVPSERKSPEDIHASYVTPPNYRRDHGFLHTMVASSGRVYLSVYAFNTFHVYKQIQILLLVLEEIYIIKIFCVYVFVFVHVIWVCVFVIMDVLKKKGQSVYSFEPRIFDLIKWVPDFIWFY